MSLTEEYRGYAAECVRLAMVRENADDKALLLQMAEQWRELAERLKKEPPEQRQLTSGQ